MKILTGANSINSIKTLEGLKQRYEQGRLPHAFLVSGSTKESRLEFALAFAKVIFAEDPASDRKIDAGNLEDLIMVEPDGEIIKVGQILELTRTFSSKPFGHGQMMAIITDAGAMSEQSQNKLLKTLEEPHAGNIIVMLADNPESLYLTVRSRTVRITLPDALPDTGEKTDADARALISLALTKNRPVSEGFQMLDGYLDDKESADALLDAMEYFLRDIITGAYAEGLVLNDGHREIAGKMKGRSWPIRPYIGHVEEARSNLRRKMNRKSCMKDMLLRMRMEVYI
jgi:DNA polymerase III delta prime subunit